jgi:hypothetical protein
MGSLTDSEMRFHDGKEHEAVQLWLGGHRHQLVELFSLMERQEPFQAQLRSGSLFRLDWVAARR